MPSKPTKAAAKRTAAPVKKQPAAKKAAAPAKKQQPPRKAPAKAAAAKKAAAPAKARKAATPTAKSPAPAAKTTGPAAKAPAKRATKRPVLDKFLQEQQELLQRERERLTQQADALKAEADQLAEEMEPGDVQFDEESGEGGTMNVERERDLALSAQARAEVEEIDRALEKILEGTYGICERCGQPIARARLKAIPQAALCVPCKSGGLLRR